MEKTLYFQSTVCVVAYCADRVYFKVKHLKVLEFCLFFKLKRCYLFLEFIFQTKSWIFTLTPAFANILQRCPETFHSIIHIFYCRSTFILYWDQRNYRILTVRFNHVFCPAFYQNVTFRIIHLMLFTLIFFE